MTVYSIASSFLVANDRPGIPGAPVDMVVPAANQAIFTIICAVPTLLACLFALRSVVKDRDYTWPIFLGGGVLGMFIEPLLDYFGGVWWPTHGDWEVFNMAGVNVPLLVVMVYPWILGGQAYVAYRAFERGMTSKRLWQLVGLFAVNDILIETVGIRLLHVYAYFGNQPLNPWGLPLWYVPCNAIGPILAAALFYSLRRRLSGPRSMLLMLTLPMGWGGAYGIIGSPIWLSLNSNWPLWLADLLAVGALGLGYLLVTAIAEATASVALVPTEQPGELSSRRA